MMTYASNPSTWIAEEGKWMCEFEASLVQLGLNRETV